MRLDSKRTLFEFEEKLVIENKNTSTTSSENVEEEVVEIPRGDI